jgi:hypothetical protein
VTSPGSREPLAAPPVPNTITQNPVRDSPSPNQPPPKAPSTALTEITLTEASQSLKPSRASHDRHYDSIPYLNNIRLRPCPNGTPNTSPEQRSGFTTTPPRRSVGTPHTRYPRGLSPCTQHPPNQPPKALDRGNLLPLSRSQPAGPAPFKHSHPLLRNSRPSQISNLPPHLKFDAHPS